MSTTDTTRPRITVHFEDEDDLEPRTGTTVVRLSTGWLITKSMWHEYAYKSVSVHSVFVPDQGHDRVPADFAGPREKEVTS